MINNKTDINTPSIEKTVQRILGEMENVEVTSEEFIKMVNLVEQLQKIKGTRNPNLPSMDASLAVVGNLVGILSILHFEKVNVVASKALGFILKSKL